MTGVLVAPLPWAVAEALYPAGSAPWSGLPVMVPPVGDIFTPNTKPPARYFNYLFNNHYKAILSTQVDQTVQAAENWQLPVKLTGSEVIDCKPSWDPVNGAWIFGVNDGTTIGIWSVYANPGAKTNGGPGQGSFGSTPFVGRICSVLKDPTDANTYYIAAIQTSDHSMHVWSFDQSVSVFTSRVTSAAHVFTDVQLGYFNGNLLVAEAAAASSVIVRSTDKGVTFTGISGATTIDCDTTFTIAVSGTQVLIVANHRTSTLEPGVLSSLDGITFTMQTFGAVFAAGDTGIGSAWVSVNNRWVFCYQPAAALGTRKFLTSPDAVTWTASATLTATPLWDLASAGPIVMGIAVDVPNGTTYLVYSLDGAVSWVRVPFAAINANVDKSWIAASSAQFAVAYKDIGGAFSDYSFSHAFDMTGAPAT